jgi:hypothetical protein
MFVNSEAFMVFESYHTCNSDSFDPTIFSHRLHNNGLSSNPSNALLFGMRRDQRVLIRLKRLIIGIEYNCATPQMNDLRKNVFMANILHVPINEQLKVLIYI